MFDFLRRRRRANAEVPAPVAPEKILIRHPFGDICEHGVRFMNQCDVCPGGWQPKPASSDQSEEKS